MEQFELECVVVGAGVVGLAVARELALSGKEVLLIEKESSIGTGISSRNSEVIHAGIYYPKGSLKAQLCVRGKELLYQYSKAEKIAHQQIGKLIVAQNSEELNRLNAIQQHARENGVLDLEFLDQRELLNIEPELSSVAALYSPSTGIIDSHAYMLQLQADFERAGGQCIFNTEIQALKFDANGILLVSKNDGTSILAKTCINSTGLSSVAFSQNIEGINKTVIPKAYFAKGSYFSYQGKVPFKHLIYPVPVNGGLGVHLTLDMNRSAKFGPDVEWLDKQATLDYQVCESKRESFAQAVRTYWPAVDESRLCADYSGVRPKISGPSEPAADFCIQDESSHGVTGLINLLGIESPGLTSSLAIAELLAQKLK